MAKRLRNETVMTMDWIAEQLQMGCRPHAGQLFESVDIFYNDRDPFMTLNDW